MRTTPLLGKALEEGNKNGTLKSWQNLILLIVGNAVNQADHNRMITSSYRN